MCNPLNLVTWEACKNIKLVDTFHVVCEEHNIERLREHNAYHIFSTISMLSMNNTLSRLKAAEICRFELMLRKRYCVKYQLSDKLQEIHLWWESKLRREIIELSQSVRDWYPWTITEQDADKIHSSHILTGLNLLIEKNLEREIIRTAEQNRLKEIAEEERIRMEDQYEEEEQMYKAERKKRKMEQRELMEMANEEEDDYYHDDSESDDSESYEYPVYYYYPATSFDMFTEIRNRKGYYGSNCLGMSSSLSTRCLINFYP